MSAGGDVLDGVATAFAGGLRVAVRAKPGLSKPRPLKIVEIGEGKRALEVSVAAPAQDGKANKALIERLASVWGVPSAAVSIKTGEGGRLKIVEVAGEADALKRILAEKLLG